MIFIPRRKMYRGRLLRRRAIEWRQTSQRRRTNTFHPQQPATSSSGGSSLFFIMIASILLFGAAYLYQVNSLTTRGYEIQDLEKRIQDIRHENEALIIESARLKSMYEIEQAAEETDLINSRELSYIETGDETVALK